MVQVIYGIFLDGIMSKKFTCTCGLAKGDVCHSTCTQCLHFGIISALFSFRLQHCLLHKGACGWVRRIKVKLEQNANFRLQHCLLHKGACGLVRRIKVKLEQNALHRFAL